MSEKYLGKLIVFEGINGCGKSVQVVRARNWLRANFKLAPVITKEPTEGFTGKQIRRALRDSHLLQALGPTVLQSWYALDSLQHLREKIVPALSQGAIVLCDRYRHSLVHSAVSESDIPELLELNKTILGDDFINPDLVFIFDVSPEIALGRLAKKGIVLDVQETLPEIARTRERYFQLLKHWPDNAHIIDGAGSEQEVFVKIRDLMAPEVKSSK